MSDGKVHLRSIGFLSLLAIFSIFALGCSDPDTTVEQKFAQAQQKLDSGESEEGLRILEALYEEFPKRFDLNEFLAFSYAAAGHSELAADFFVKAAELAPDRGALLLFAAQAREDAGDLDQAADHYRVHLSDNYDDFSAWQALARLEQRRGRLEDAIDAHRHVHRLRPSASTAAQVGDLYLRVRNLAQAHQWFNTSREKPDGPAPKALLGLLRISMEEGNWDRAQELVVELDSEHPGALDDSEMAETRAELRRWHESLEEMEALRRQQAERAAQREAERKEREEEEERLAREREREEAEAAAAAEAEAEAEAERARLAEREAEEALEEEEEVEPDPGEVLLAEANRLFEAGRYSAAARHYWRALSYDDTSAQTWFDLSRSHFRAESWNDAELTALEALRRDPDRQVLHLHYLNVIKETHSVRSYLRELERTHERFPANPEIVLALANTYARSQHAHDQAVRYYNLFLRIAPNDPRRSQVEQSIRRLSRP